jgi:hypothetical protein
MVTVKVGILPVNVQSFHGPAIGAGRGANAGSLCFGTVFAKTGAVVGKGKQRITAGPCVRAGTELVSEP